MSTENRTYSNHPIQETKEERRARRFREISWILYDCGNSAYTLTMDTAIFPLYFALIAGTSSISLGFYKSLAGMFIALISPVLGTIADYKGYKMKFFQVFNTLGILMTALMGILPLNEAEPLVVIFILSNIGYAASNVFYDAFLVDVTTDERMDRISSRGYAYGYIASVVPFLLSLICVFLLGQQNTSGYRISFLISAIWWAICSIPITKFVKQKHYIEPEAKPIQKSFQRLLKTFKEIRSYRYIVLFLVSYFFYIDGVNTFIKMVVPFSQDILGKEKFSALILLGILLLIQIVAFPCALLFGALSKKFGCLPMIRIGILSYLFTSFAAYFISEMWHVFALGMIIAFAQGGIQALSRSYFAQIIPKNKSNEFFGFYNVVGKFTAILGPFLMSTIGTLTGTVNLTILGVSPLFLLGLIFSLFLPKDKTL